MIKKIKRLFHYLLVPNEYNNFRAKLLHHDVLTAYLVAVFIMVFASRYVGSFTGDILGVATDITVGKLFELTNDQRKQSGLPTLTYNQKLAQAAQLKANDMFAKNYWSHYGPAGETPWNFMLDSGYRYEVAGENLAKNFLYSRNVVSAWMDSPTHRDNILRSDFSEVGFAVQNGVLNGEATTLVVQMFGKPSITISAQEQQQQAIRSLPTRETVLAQSTREPLVTIPFTPIQMVSIFMMFLIVVFAVDFYIASKLKLIRMHGKSLAHLIFLITITAGAILVLSKGSIL